MTLITWFNPMTWKTDQVNNIIGFFSAAATVGALWYAFHLERKNSKKINDLANIVTKLSEANSLQQDHNKILNRQANLQNIKLKNESRPIFEAPRTIISLNAELKIILTNIGHRAIVTTINFPSENEIQFNCNQKVIDRTSSLTIRGKSKSNKFVNECNYIMQINFTDVYGNYYFTTIRGKGVHITAYNTVDDDHYSTSQDTTS